MTIEAMALEVCQLVIQMAETSLNCGICAEGEDGLIAGGEDPWQHAPGCPYPKAREVLKAAQEQGRIS